MFSFEIPKPKDIKKTLVSTRQKITGGGGTFSGDDKSGRFSGRGISGIYTIGASSVKINITKKPFIYPESSVKSAIADYFKE
jgi:hypothetical protein